MKSHWKGPKFNPTNSHWISPLLDINNCELSILDLLGQLCEEGRNFQSCHIVAAQIFNDKFGQKIFRIKLLQHAQQPNSFDSVVFVRYYIKQIASGEYCLWAFLFNFTKTSGQCTIFAKKCTFNTNYSNPFFGVLDKNNT